MQLQYCNVFDAMIAYIYIREEESRRSGVIDATRPSKEAELCGHRRSLPWRAFKTDWFSSVDAYYAKPRFDSFVIDFSHEFISDICFVTPTIFFPMAAGRVVKYSTHMTNIRHITCSPFTALLGWTSGRTSAVLCVSCSRTCTCFSFVCVDARTISIL